MNAVHRFLLDHLGRHIAPEETTPERVLGANHPIFGCRGVHKTTGRPNCRGVIGNPKSIYLVTESLVVVDVYLGNFYMSPKASEKKKNDGKSSYPIHEHWPVLLRERGVGHDFPVRVRVWRSQESAGEPVPPEVLDAYLGFPLTFMDSIMRMVRFYDNLLPAPIWKSLTRLAREGAPYLCFRPSMSQANIMPHLMLFRGEVGVSTENGKTRISIDRIDTIERVARYGARPVYVYRAIRAMCRGMSAPQMPKAVKGDEKSDETINWLTRRLRDSRRWDENDVSTCRDLEPGLVDTLCEIDEIASLEALTDMELHQAQMAVDPA